MRSLLFGAAAFIESLAMGQGFNERYDAFGWGFAQGAFNIELLEDGYMVTSTSADVDSLGPDFWLSHYSVLLTKLDFNGAKQWEKRAYRPYHGTTAGWSNCCDTIPGGGYVVGGASEDTTGFDEVYLMRFDANGDTLWTKVFGDPNGNDFWIGYQVKRTTDGDFLIVGFTGTEGLASYQAFAIRTDENGNELWRRTYSWPGNPFCGFLSSSLAGAGELFMAGSHNITISNTDHWVQRTDSLGNLKWRVRWGGPFSDAGTQIITAADGHVLVFSARGYAANSQAMRCYIAKLDSTDGSIIWENEFGPTAPSTLFLAGKECPNGDLIATGATYANMGMGSGQKGLLCRTTSEGDSLWMFAYFSVADGLTDGTGRFYDVLPTADGGFIAAGAAYFSASGNNPPGISQDTWVVKVDSMGCIVPGCNNVGITEQATNLLGALHIFPNPAQGQATLQLTLPPGVGNGPFELTLMATDGRVVRRERIAGNVEHRLALDRQPSGMYYVHVADEGKWLTGGKLVLE
ncbi:MAG: T9SS type A sorting domain-containing protein [Flavobacteriales bacterium]|nr:T9SS type A sorting domain-containing protein [Flavobacteriales bacterium]